LKQYLITKGTLQLISECHSEMCKEKQNRKDAKQVIMSQGPRRTKQFIAPECVTVVVVLPIFSFFSLQKK